MYKNRVESKGGVENEGLKHQFSQMKFTKLQPQAIRHTPCTISKKMFFFKNVKKDRIQGSIWFKLVLGLLVLGPLSKMALSVHSLTYQPYTW